jgi:3-oxoacyl-[acyl-carrier-protein] synthase-3
MRPAVPQRGAHYAVATVNDVLHNPLSAVKDISEIDDCMIHTGSKKILDGVCSQLHIDTDSTRVNKSYDVLEQFGNLSSASTGFMLASKKEWAGPAMVVGFGVGFTASAGLMNVN